jgi:type III pantothenate kinase
MLLVIDVGNTNTVRGVYEGKKLLAHWRVETSARRTYDEYGILVLQLFGWSGIEPGRVTAVAVSSVVPPLQFNLEKMSERYFKTRPMFVGPGVKTGMPILYDNPREVGADRIVNSVAAYEKHHGGLIVVDFGTATTFDVVDHDGAYVGGVIAPGVNLSLKALHDAAAALPFIDVSKPERVVGTNTVACMQSGVYWGYVGLIEGVCARIRAERGVPMTVVGTGGLSTLFAQGTDVLEKIDTGLTIHGLVLIDRLNRE